MDVIGYEIKKNIENHKRTRIYCKVIHLPFPYVDTFFLSHQIQLYIT